MTAEAPTETTPTPDLRGLWVPIVTPFSPTGEVDAGSLRRLAVRLLAEGATGLVALGTTGEPATLTAGERRLVVEVCGEVCKAHGRRLIVGLGTNDTRTTIDEITGWNDAAPAAAAYLVVVPYYTRPSEAGVVDHLRRAAEAGAAPVIAYNVPYRTGRGLGADALIELAATPNVVGVKQAVGSLDHDTLALLARRPPGFHVFSGDDAFITPTILLGGAGAIAAAAHLHTRRFGALVDAALAGDAPASAALAHDLLPTVDAGVAEPSPALWKAALHATGDIAHPGVRSPLTPATPTATERLLATVAA